MDSIKQVDILIGLPGSGKSTWAAKQAETEGALIVNKDSLRTMFSGGKYQYIESREELICTITNFAVVQALFDNNYVIVDETHITRKSRLLILDFVKSYYDDEIRIRYVVFPDSDSSLERRIADNRGICAEKWTEVFNSMRQNFEQVQTDEGYEEIIYI